jgi:hypothetical protein
MSARISALDYDRGRRYDPSLAPVATGLRQGKPILRDGRPIEALQRSVKKKGNMIRADVGCDLRPKREDGGLAAGDSPEGVCDRGGTWIRPARLSTPN